MSDYFPEEIVQEILLRLPIKSAIKCCLVCRSWRSRIQSSAFIHARLRHTVRSNDQNGTHLLLLNSTTRRDAITCYVLGEFFSLRWDNAAIGECTDLINPFYYNNIAYSPPKTTFLARRFPVVGTCNGLVCLAGRFATIIWNPCVRKYMFLPRPGVIDNKNRKERDLQHISYAFGYDSRTNDYKVLRTVGGYDYSCEVEVWSLARGSWKSLSAAVIPAGFDGFHIAVYAENKVLVNGMPVWAQRLKNEGNCIVFFDMGSESFGKIMVPEALRKENVPISRYGESIVMFETHYQKQEHATYLHMWVMKEFGVAESWTKLLSITVEGIATKPLGCRHSEVVLGIYGGSSRRVSLDPETREVKGLEIDTDKHHYFMDSYVESLALLGQPDAISY